MDVNDMLAYFKERIGDLEYQLAYKVAELKDKERTIQNLQMEVENLKRNGENK